MKITINKNDIGNITIKKVYYIEIISVMYDIRFSVSSIDKQVRVWSYLTNEW